MTSSAKPAGECFGCELTWTNSDSSAITLDASKDLWPRCDDAGLVKSTEWTNEKHSRYLDSLEASFVDELYHSMNLRGHGMKKYSRIPYSSEQAAVLGDERRKKIKYETEEPLLDSTADSRAMIESPLCTMEYVDAHEHVTFRNSGRHLSGKLNSSYGSRRSSEHNHVGHKSHQDIVGGSAEVSDQNFVDIHGGNSSRKSMAKRLKTAASDCSNKYQEQGCKEFLLEQS